MNVSTCEIVTGQQFCNTTIALWNPRISVTGRLVAIILPSLYAITMMTLLFVLWNSKLKQQDNINFLDFIKGVYKRNHRLLYMKFHVGDNYSQMKQEMKHEIKHEMKQDVKQEMGSRDIITEYHVESADVLTKFTIDGVVSRLPDTCNSEVFEIKMTAADVATAKKHRKFLKLITLPLFCANFVMVFKLLALPLFSILWNIVDVFFDAFYFYKLESGGLIDGRITRNIHVNNSILVFSCLGSLASTIVALFYLGVVYSYEKEREHHSWTVFAKMLAASTKLLLEDAPELLLEYFFVDKYIVSGSSTPPWYLVGKDVITALIYILPLFQIASSVVKDFKLTREKKGNFGCFVYTTITAARVFMSFGLVFRVVGMIIQYMRTSVNKECYIILEMSLLIQRPFASGCLNWCDWIVLIFTNLTLATAIPTASLTIFSMCLYMCGFRHRD